MESEIKSSCGTSLVSDSSREAVLTVSPTAVYSSRRAEPTLPDISGPLETPMPTANPSWPLVSNSH